MMWLPMICLAKQCFGNAEPDLCPAGTRKIRRSGELLGRLAAPVIAVLLSVISVTANAQTVLVLQHANLIDGSSPEPIRNASVVIRGRDIETVQTTAGSLPANAKLIDLKGGWLLPGFVDAHTHLHDVASARRALQYGSTTVRVMGTPMFMDVGMRELHNAGASDVPAVVAASYQIRPDIIQAWPSFELDFPNLRRLTSGLHGADDLRAVVRAIAARHVDLIKVLATERSGTPDRPAEAHLQ
jgi:imidazolonepropionase-like amidohydrolase